ncbi:TolC family protein [Candidatus Nitrosacidococcus tergens]|uniref:Outer membrane protein n=1 Tax=Candidatus Nitrosacidococcus tergens TaxID=553981 RepID=A0A7G1Q9T2_9GAMM|nr:TolC family protein [Candidatus Nitrosacidococcus tergens]CAB1275527.1 Outer membrane protein [Candidatus Nitrosacidococcus tergens]
MMVSQNRFNLRSAWVFILFITYNLCFAQSHLSSVSDLENSSSLNIPNLSSVISNSFFSAQEGFLVNLKGLTLNEVIERSLTHDPLIRAGLESINQAEAEVITAGLLPNPTFLTNQELMPLTHPYTPEQEGGPPQLNVAIEFPIDWFVFGKRAAAIIAAKKGVDVATANFYELIRERIYGAISAFYDALEAQAMLALAQESLGNFTAVEQYILAQNKTIPSNNIRLERVRLSLFSSRQDVRDKKIKLIETISRLRVFLGIKKPLDLNLAGQLEVSTPLSPPSLEGAIAIAKENRPDFLASQYEITQAEAGIQLEKKQAYPEIIPYIGYNRQFQRKVLNMPDANSWQAGFQLDIPLFDRNQGNIAKMESIHTQAKLNLEAKILELQAEVEQALEAYQAAYETITIEDPAKLKMAQNIRNRVHIDTHTFMEVIDAQEVYLETYQIHINNLSNYWHTLYAFNAAVGKQVLK